MPPLLYYPLSGNAPLLYYPLSGNAPLLYYPLSGWTESLNMGVAAALIMHVVLERVPSLRGGAKPTSCWNDDDSGTHALHGRTRSACSSTKRFSEGSLGVDGHAGLAI